MLQKVHTNVVGHRLIDNGQVVEDVTSVTLPNIEHPTTEISGISGMAVDVEMPNAAHLNAMEFSVAHNNGMNCRYLATPGKHTMEVRIARQNYNVAQADMEYQSVKYRVTGVHKSTEKGTVETNNPLGSTEKYSVLRYEEEVDGEIVTLIDAMAGIIRYNGVSYTDQIDAMLN